MLKCCFVKMVDLVVLDIMLDDDVVGVRLTFRNFTPFKLQYDKLSTNQLVPGRVPVLTIVRTVL